MCSVCSESIKHSKFNTVRHKRGEGYISVVAWGSTYLSVLNDDQLSYYDPLNLTVKALFLAHRGLYNFRPN